MRTSILPVLVFSLLLARPAVAQNAPKPTDRDEVNQIEALLINIKETVTDLSDRVTFLSDKVDTLVLQQRQVEPVQLPHPTKTPLVFRILSLGMVR